MKELFRKILILIWRFRSRFLPAVSMSTRGKKIAFILLSYNRAFNIDDILRAAAKCEFIDKIILSNNNPDIEIRKYVSLKDPRLQIIENVETKRPGFRWELAQSLAADCDIFICPDDDVFLYPGQIKILTEHALNDDQQAHGVCGSINGAYTKDVDIRCDVLHRCYVISGSILKRYFDLIRHIPFYLENGVVLGDDMTISLAAPKQPLIHDVGFVLSCRTSLMQGYAVNQEAGFDEQRALIYQQAQQAVKLLSE